MLFFDSDDIFWKGFFLSVKIFLPMDFKLLALFKSKYPNPFR